MFDTDASAIANSTKSTNYLFPRVYAMPITNGSEYPLAGTSFVTTDSISLIIDFLVITHA
jgi:hypothetical protein